MQYLVFSSLFFLYCFLPIVLISYFAVKNQAYRNTVLILASLFFYAWGEPIWVCILVLTVVMDHLHARIIEKYRGQWQSRVALLSSLLMNFCVLGFFKYWGFIIKSINSLLGTSITYQEFALPLGISFYTFQTISYVIDVYRGDVAVQKNFGKQLLYISLFPQLVAGPIVRYKDIAEQIDNRIVTLAGFSQGITRFTIGLGKKVLLANTAGEIADAFLKGDLSALSVAGAWFGIALYALQIYFDFSGYSDMAIGLGKMFGFTYKENFNYPYISKTAAEFWRRWHISLGSFFRDYVYIPLGGKYRMYIRNLLVVWFLTGLWHGASWNFVIWGLYYGLLIFLENAFLNRIMQRIPAFFSHIYLLLAVLVGWVFFYYTDLSQGLLLLRVMFGISTAPLSDQVFALHFVNNVVFFLVAIVSCTPLLGWLKRSVERFSLAKSGKVYLAKGIYQPVLNVLILFIATILLVGKSYNPFLYFRF